MPRDGYKGVAFIDDRSFIVCDDGDHVIYLGVLDPDGNGCKLALIAGEKGVSETVDADEGLKAKCSKPDGPCIDRQNWVCYFCDRTTKTVRAMDLRPPYAVRTIVSVAEVPTHSGEIPTKKIDPLRILLHPTEDVAFVVDRKQGYIYKINDLRSPAPDVYMYHDNPDHELKLLHGMNWPIAPVHGCTIWDTEHAQWANDATFECQPVLTNNQMQTCLNFFLVVGGNKAWFVDATHTDRSTNPKYTLACDYAVFLERYQADEGIFLTSNTVLSLNRNSHRPGVWQLTTNSNWSTPEAVECRWIADRGLIAPHGMDLSPSKKLVIVADTGRENKGQLLLAKIRLSPEEANVRVNSVVVLQETELTLAEVEPLYLNPTLEPEQVDSDNEDTEAPAEGASRVLTASSTSHGYTHLKAKPGRGKTAFEKEFRRKTAYGLSTNTRETKCNQS